MSCVARFPVEPTELNPLTIDNISRNGSGMRMVLILQVVHMNRSAPVKNLGSGLGLPTETDNSISVVGDSGPI